MMGCVGRGHAETVIEQPLACSGHVDQASVEDRAFGFIGVEAVVEEMMDQPARLRDPEHVSVVGSAGQWIGGSLAILLCVPEE